MGKIWLKSVDPNRQCCGCEGKSGPCSQCCKKGELGSYSVYNTANLPENTIVKLDNGPGQLEYIFPNKIKTTNLSPSVNSTFSFQLTLKIGDLISSSVTAGEKTNIVFPSCEDQFSSERLPSTLQVGFLTPRGNSIIPNVITATVDKFGDSFGSELIGTASYFLFGCDPEIVTQDINSPQPNHDGAVNIIYRTFSQVFKTVVYQFENPLPNPSFVPLYPNQSFSFFNNGINSSFSSFYGRENIDFSCSQEILIQGCSPPREPYKYTPTPLPQIDAPLATSSTSFRIKSLKKYSEGVYTNISSACSAVIISNNSEVSFFDKNGDPIDISKKLIKINLP